MGTMKLQPMPNQVLIQPLRETEQLLPSGLVLPKQRKISPTEATVEAIGAGVTDKIKVGQRIVFQKFAGETLPNGQIIVRQEHILCILGEEVEHGVSVQE